MLERGCRDVLEFEFEFGDRFVGVVANLDVVGHVDADDFVVVDNSVIINGFDIGVNTFVDDDSVVVIVHVDAGDFVVVDDLVIVTNFVIVVNTSVDDNSVVGEHTATGNVVCSDWGVEEVSSSARKGLAEWVTCLYDTCLACFRLWSVFHRCESVSGFAARGFGSHSGKYCSRSNGGSICQ